MSICFPFSTTFEISENADDANDDIETNLLQQSGSLLRSATFLLKLYRAEDLPRMDSAFLHGVKKIFNGQEDVKELVDPYVTFTFAGQHIESKIIYACSHPEFNQELRLGLKLPSMCNKLTISVMDWDRLTNNDYIGVHNIDLSSISSDKQDGFLPTFGPCWINLYGSPREFSEIPSVLDILNSGKGEGVAYRGRVLFELATVLSETPLEPLIDIPNSEIVRSLPFQSRKKFKLHVVFYDATMLYEHTSMIEFEVSMGNYGKKLEDVVGSTNSSITPPTNPVFDGTSYYYLPWGNAKPTAQVISEWEDVTFRLETINQLSKTRLLINGILSSIKSLKLKHTSEDIIVRQYRQSLEMVIAQLIKPLPNAEAGRHHTNQLDRLRRQMRDKIIGDLIVNLENMKLKPDTTSKEFEETFLDICNNLQNLEVEPQNSIPDIIIWLLCGGKRFAYYRLPAHEVLYSPQKDRKGRLCGKLQTITMKWPGKESEIEKDKKKFLPAQVRVKVWLGTQTNEHDWLSSEKGGELVVYAETYENQVNIIGKWTTGGPLMSRPAWSDLTGNIDLPQKNFQLPPNWRWDGDWYISPDIR
ncbi:unnamed protein product [Didymodactylos carnosus]|uniref:C2 domain-containing protein n=1 Tax=Didymodactylos carnosus TaxID=1234261 RepID=A0A814TJA5_9BILA|nr:unnamed protein product [Didymodactylos carnosus]CAF3924429.1 unnamed protein product [Didymodactylos carnosus]